MIAAIFRSSRSMPVVGNPLRANSTARGRPTYPRPTTPARGRREAIFSRNAVASADIRRSLTRLFEPVRKGTAGAAGHHPFRLPEEDGCAIADSWELRGA